MQTTLEKREAIKRFPAENPCICYNIRKAARAITHIYDELFRSIGITVTQAMILNTMRAFESLTISQLAEAMATDRTTITRNLKPLERDGYIKIEPGQDKREREVRISRKGENVSMEAFEIWQKFQNKVLKSVGKNQFDQVCKDLAVTVEEIQKI